MSFLKNLFSKKEVQITASTEDFWTWFASNEKQFWSVLKYGKNIESNFVNLIGPKLDSLRKAITF